VQPGEGASHSPLPNFLKADTLHLLSNISISIIWCNIEVRKQAHPKSIIENPGTEDFNLLSRSTFKQNHFFIHNTDFVGEAIDPGIIYFMFEK
jgi:hypothetical protein